MNSKLLSLFSTPRVENGDYRVPWTHPDKHKSRWSIYSLNLVIQLANLRPNPLMYCDKQRQLIQSIPASDEAEYKNRLTNY